MIQRIFITIIFGCLSLGTLMVILDCIEGERLRDSIKTWAFGISFLTVFSYPIIGVWTNPKK